MRWRLILEKHNPKFIHIQGAENIAADALSRLDTIDTNNPIRPYMSSLAEHFSFEKEDVLQKTIIQYQQNN